MNMDERNVEILKISAFLVAGAGILVALYVFFLIPQSKKVRALRTDMVYLEGKAKQYAHFEEYRDKLTMQQTRIDEVLRAANFDRLLADKADQKVFEMLSRISAETNVSLDKINHSQSTDRRQQQIWDIGFKATYGRAVAFMSLLEQSFTIKRFNIANGGDASSRIVTMLISPIDMSAAVSSSLRPGKDLLDMYDELDVALKKQGTGTDTVEQSREEIGDPMSFGKRIIYSGSEPSGRKEVVRKEKESPALRLPSVRPEDIFVDADVLFVVIDGKVYKEDEEIGDYKIVKIREKSVDILWQSRIYTLKPDKQ